MSDTPSGAQPRRLLLVEDDPNDAELTQLLIADTGDSWLCEVVRSVRAAVERLKHGGIDVVLMDLGLPDGIGLLAAEEVVSRAGGVPVIVLSGSADNETIARAARRAGAKGCLMKGRVEADEMRRTLRAALHNTAEGPRDSG